VRYLIPVVAATVICAFGVLAGDKSQSSPKDGSSKLHPEDEVCSIDVSTSPSREVLDANPSLVRWLLEVVTTDSDDTVQSGASQALSRLAPVATVELINELENNSTQIRAAAIGYLAGCTTTPDFPRKELVGKLL